jgi:hypothetical protein
VFYELFKWFDGGDAGDGEAGVVGDPSDQRRIEREGIERLNGSLLYETGWVGEAGVPSTLVSTESI